MEAVVLALVPSMYAACQSQFPKTCATCGKRFASFASYLDGTEALGEPQLDPSYSQDPIGMLCFANCSCQSTLALVYEDVRLHDAFNQAIESEALLSGRTVAVVVKELVELLHERTMRDKSKARTKGLAHEGPDPLIAEVGAALVDMVQKGNLRIPPYSAVAERVQRLIRKRDFGLAQITELVAVDQALASAVLRLANSSLFKRSAEITALPVAVTRIGADEIAKLAFATSFSGYALSTGTLTAARQRLWHQSVTSAFLSRHIGKMRGLAPESCFAAGLLHDIGSLLAAVNLETFFSKRKLTPRPLTSWLSVIERFHVQIGNMAAESWQLPRAVRDCIAYHHVVSREGCEHSSLVDVVTAADGVRYALEQHSHVSMAVLEHVPYLRSDAERQAMVEALPHIPQLIATFEPDRVSSEASMVEKRPRKKPKRNAKTKAPILRNVAKPIQRFDLLSVDKTGLFVQSPMALPESFLIELSVDDGRPFRLWAKVESCVEKGLEHEMVLLPFALDAEGQVRWDAFVSLHT